MPLTCQPCGAPLRQGAKYLAVSVREDDGSLVLRIGCEHLPVKGIEEAVRRGLAVVFGSGGCFSEWLEDLLAPCQHNKTDH